MVMLILALACVCILGAIGVVLVICFVLWIVFMVAGESNSKSYGVHVSRPGITPTSPKPRPPAQNQKGEIIMTDAELANMVRGIARHMPSVNHQENKALQEAAKRLAQLAAPARLLTYEEIQQLPENAVVWEEWQARLDKEWATEWGIAPVARMGNSLVGNGIITTIMPDMMDSSDYGQSRWWSSMPTRAQREETPWQTPEKDPHQTV